MEKNKKLIRTFIAFDIEESLRQQITAIIDLLKQQKNTKKIKADKIFFISVLLSNNI